MDACVKIAIIVITVVSLVEVTVDTNAGVINTITTIDIVVESPVIVDSRGHSVVGATWLTGGATIKTTIDCPTGDAVAVNSRSCLVILSLSCFAGTWAWCRILANGGGFAAPNALPGQAAATSSS